MRAWKQGFSRAAINANKAMRPTAAWVNSATALLILVLYAPVALSDSDCRQFTANTGTWHSSIAAALAERPTYCATNQNSCNDLHCTPAWQAIGRVCVFSVISPPSPPLPAPFTENLSWTATTIGHPPGSSTQTTYMSQRANPAGCQMYVSAALGPASNCGASCNSVSDPIEPANGGMHSSEADVTGNGTSLQFKRFYNSAESNHGLSAGWRYSFGRSVKPQYSSSTHQPYAPTPDNSSLYTTEAAACTSGFAEIKSRVSTWANATASYGNGACTLTVGATTIGTLPVLYTSPPTPAPGTTVLIGVDAIRDDGQLVRFMVNGSSLVALPSINLKLQQTGSGYTLTDADDTVEAYDTSGRLMSITSRAGVVQTMSYDTSGRLSTVTDSFGHQITLGYDTQNRLSTVTRQ